MSPNSFSKHLEEEDLLVSKVVTPSNLFLSHSGSIFICGKKRQFIEINLMFFLVKLMFIRKTSFLPQ